MRVWCVSVCVVCVRVCGCGVCSVCVCVWCAGVVCECVCGVCVCVGVVCVVCAGVVCVCVCFDKVSNHKAANSGKHRSLAKQNTVNTVTV